LAWPPSQFDNYCHIAGEYKHNIGKLYNDIKRLTIYGMFDNLRHVSQRNPYPNETS